MFFPSHLKDCSRRRSPFLAAGWERRRGCGREGESRRRGPCFVFGGGGWQTPPFCHSVHPYSLQMADGQEYNTPPRPFIYLSLGANWRFNRLSFATSSSLYLSPSRPDFRLEIRRPDEPVPVFPDEPCAPGAAGGPSRAVSKEELTLAPTYVRNGPHVLRIFTVG